MFDSRHWCYRYSLGTRVSVVFFKIISVPIKRSAVQKKHHWSDNRIHVDDTSYSFGVDYALTALPSCYSYRSMFVPHKHIASDIFQALKYRITLIFTPSVSQNHILLEKISSRKHLYK